MPTSYPCTMVSVSARFGSKSFPRTKDGTYKFTPLSTGLHEVKIKAEHGLSASLDMTEYDEVVARISNSPMKMGHDDVYILDRPVDLTSVLKDLGHAEEDSSQWTQSSVGMIVRVKPDVLFTGPTDCLLLSRDTNVPVGGKDAWRWTLIPETKLEEIPADSTFQGDGKLNYWKEELDLIKQPHQEGYTLIEPCGAKLTCTDASGTDHSSTIAQISPTYQFKLMCLEPDRCGFKYTIETQPSVISLVDWGTETKYDCFTC